MTVTIENAYGLYINITVDEIARLKRCIAEADAKHSAEVVVDFNGEKREFTFEQFHDVLFGPTRTVWTEEQIQEAVRPAIRIILDNMDDMDNYRAERLVVDYLRDLDAPPAATGGAGT